jgi:hypothetical protein
MEIVCDRVDGTFITEFRKWSAAVPVVEGKKNPTTRERSPGTTEASVRTLAAVINFAHHRRETAFKAGFTAKPPSSVSRTPTYRATVEELAAMFRYCIEPRARGNEPEWSEKMIDRQRLFRRNLLRFLQISVATWCRPDAAHDVSTKRERDQWLSNAQVLQLNPRGRTQTKKYRPAVPVPARSARLLDRTNGFYVTVGSVRKAFEAMLDELQLPRDRETGLKLIAAACRRSCAGGSGRRWVQGQIMLGHHKATTSDLYALFDMANLGVVHRHGARYGASARDIALPGGMNGHALVWPSRTKRTTGNKKADPKAGFSDTSKTSNWSGKEDLNLRPLPPEDSALPG